MITLKSFDTVLPVENNAVPANSPPTGADNHLTAQVFYDDTWDREAQGIVIFFSGGSGRGYVDTVTTERTTTVVSAGYVYINTLAFPQQPAGISRSNQSPVHNYYAYSVEVQSYLDLIVDTLVNDPDLSTIITANTPVVICGTSRGAGMVLQWSELSRGVYANHKDRVVGVAAQSPAGGGTSRTWNGAYIAMRATYRFFESVNHKTLAMFGAGDVTHTTRSQIERLNRVWTNPLVTLNIVGDSTYTHTWTYSHQAEFMNYVLTLFQS